uniref:Uncharacterized protein n=1 Tax=Cercocebus atys TaxID=9531 RepID=A0A2K5MI29_CERAT
PGWSRSPDLVCVCVFWVGVVASREEKGDLEALFSKSMTSKTKMIKPRIWKHSFVDHRNLCWLNIDFFFCIIFLIRDTKH